jgi:chromosome segregation ATPase
MIAAPLTCFGAMLFAGVRQTRQIQSANSRANAAAATNAQLKLQTEAANAEQRKAAENLERLRSQLESMQSQGKAAGVNVEEMQKSLDEAKRKLEELKKRQEATTQGSDAMEVNGNAASKPNQPITPAER